MDEQIFEQVDETVEEHEDNTQSDAEEGDADTVESDDGSVVADTETENETTEKVEDDSFVPEPDPETRSMRLKAERAYTEAVESLKKIKNGDFDPSDPKFSDPDYRPDSYSDVFKEVERRMEAKQQAEREATKQLEQSARALIDAQYDELKSQGCKAERDELIEIADKWGFNDLFKAFDLYRETNKADERAEKRTVKNLAKRKVESVASGKPSSGSTGGIDYKQLRESNGIMDAVSRYLGR